MDKELIEVNQMFEEGRLEEASLKMMPWPSMKLLTFYLEYPNNQNKLKSQELNSFWHKRLNQLKLPKAPKFKFITQPGLSDADFVLGYLFYLLALRNKNEKNYLLYLNHSMLHHSMHAHQTCFNALLFTKFEEVEKLENIAHLLMSWETFADTHGVPGYLLLANGYLQLGKLAADLKNSDQVGSAFYLVWKNLHLAKLSEPFCSNSIHNAYFGQGLFLSNPMGFQSIHEMQLSCSELAQNFLSDEDKFRAENEAKRIFVSLSHSFNPLRNNRDLWQPSRAQSQEDNTKCHPAP